MAMMNEEEVAAAIRTFRTPELLEHILLYLLESLHVITDQEDPRSVRTNHNASSLAHLLRCTEVCRTWQRGIHDSGRLQRALFIVPDFRSRRNWQHGASSSPQAEQIRLRSYYRAPPLRAPILNPVIQITFPAYHLRFWHLSLEVTGNKHVAYLIITRMDLPDLKARAKTKQGQSLTKMYFSQPPLTALEATIWEERDETKDYVGRTAVLKEPIIECEGGLTLGLVHERVGQLFEQYRDVAAIKLTTT